MRAECLVVLCVAALVWHSDALLCSQKVPYNGSCGNWRKVSIINRGTLRYACCPHGWMVSSYSCVSPSYYHQRTCPSHSYGTASPYIECSRGAPKSTQGPKCNSCLSSCRGYSWCCTGRGCVCEKECVTIRSCGTGWVHKVSCANPYLPCMSLGCCPSGWTFVGSSKCRSPNGFRGVCPRQTFPTLPPPPTPSPTPKPPASTPKPPTPGLPPQERQVPTSPPGPAPLEVQLRFSMTSSLEQSQSTIDRLWMIHDSLVQVLGGQNARCKDLCVEGGECWPCRRSAEEERRVALAIASTTYILTTVVDTTLSPEEAERRVRDNGASIVGHMPSATFLSSSVKPASSGGGSDDTAIIVGAVVGGVVFLIILTIIACCACRGKKEEGKQELNVREMKVEKPRPEPLPPQQAQPAEGDVIPYGGAKEV